MLQHTSAPRCPRPALRVGVTGHRLGRLVAVDPDLAWTTEAIRAALAEIARAAGDAAVWAPGVYADSDPLLRVVTSLAEGADQLAAAAGAELGYRVDVILPFAADAYLAHFDYDPSWTVPDPRAVYAQLMQSDAIGAVQQLDGSDCVASRDAAYLNAGHAVIRHADIVLAVWNGEPAAGRGGTGDIVEFARDRRVPLVWINPVNKTRTLLVHEQPAATAHSVGQLIRALVVPPTAEHDGVASADALRRYLGPAPRVRPAGIFAAAVRLAALEWPVFRRPARASRFVEQARQAWDAALLRDALQEDLHHVLAETVVPHYAWADGLAEHFGAFYRDTFTFMYLLAPFAVATALLGNFGAAIFGRGEWWWGAIAVTELVILAMILLAYWRASMTHCHERWIDYRSLAEEVRHLLFLWPLGHPVVDVRPSGEAATEAPEITWVAWLSRAIVRELGVCPGVLNAERLNGCRTLLLDRVLAGQIDYHAANEQRMERIHHRLHAGATLLFLIAAVIAALHVLSLAVTRHGAASTERGRTEIAVGIVAVLLPTCAASLHGFLSQGDFWNIARRSRHMRQRLTALREQIADRAVNATELGDSAESVADALRDEVLNWRVFVRLKPIALV